MAGEKVKKVLFSATERQLNIFSNYYITLIIIMLLNNTK